VAGIRKIIVAVAVAGALALALPAGAAGSVAGPRLDVARVSRWAASVEVIGLEGDNAAAVHRLWGEFVAGLPAQESCLLANPPTIQAKADMRPRAAYAPSISTLYVKPGDLDRLVVFHELAHHLDFTCGAAEAIGEDFRSAQGIAASKPWWQHGSPVTWPAEYFANAVAISLGEHSRHGVSAAAVDVVSVWTGRSPAPDQIAPLTVAPPSPLVARLI